VKKPWLLLAAIVVPGGFALAAAAGADVSGLLAPKEPGVVTIGPAAPSLTAKWIIAGMSGEDVLNDGPDQLAGSLPRAAVPNTFTSTANADGWPGGGDTPASLFDPEWLDERLGGGGAGNGAPATPIADQGSPSFALAPSRTAGGGYGGYGGYYGGGGGGGNGRGVIDPGGGGTPDPVIPPVPLPSALILFGAGAFGVACVGMRRGRGVST
jgi:hypothetical protein